MRTRMTRAAATLTALAAGALAAYTLRPADQTSATLAARNPAVEVRTQVIRRTIHIVRHQPAGQAPHRPHRTLVASLDAAGRNPSYRPGGSVRTGASGSHRSAPVTGGSYPAAPAALATRTSGSHAASGSSPTSYGPTPAPARTPVTTRSSQSSSAYSPTPSHLTSGAATPASHPVTTRTSGSPRTSGPTIGSSSGRPPVTTRTSGGHSGGEGDANPSGDN